MLAGRSARDGEVIQFLAGAPELLSRYRHAPPAAAALIDAAMDARRLGMGAGLPQAFLDAAAPGYLTDAQWDALGEDWLEQALAYAAVPSKGARGPLTRIRPRPASRAARTRGDQPARTAAAARPLYRLADYLDQHGRAHRASLFPPAQFWSAAAAHAAPGDQAVLGDAAHARGLYRDAVQLHKNAAASGNTRAALYFTLPPACLRTDPRPAHWAAAHAPLANPYDAGELLDFLLLARADEQAAALLARDPAAHAALDDPYYVAHLLGSLRWAGADEQVAALATRAAARVPLDDPQRVAILLDSLREAGADEQAAALATRAAARVPLGNPYGVGRLLESLREVGADEQAAALLARDPAAHAALDNPGSVAWLLDTLRKVVASSPCSHPAAALLARDPAAHAALDSLYGVVRLLDSLREAGADEQAAALAARAAAHAPLDNPHDVAWLLNSLRKAGAHEQATTLTDRLPTAGMFGLFLEQKGLADQFRFGCEADGIPAAPWGWEDLDLWLAHDRGDHEATLPVGLPPTRRIRKVSLDSSLSGRPELHCRAQLSAPAPRRVHPDRTGMAGARSAQFRVLGGPERRHNRALRFRAPRRALILASRSRLRSCCPHKLRDREAAAPCRNEE